MVLNWPITNQQRPTWLQWRTGYKLLKKYKLKNQPAISMSFSLVNQKTGSDFPNPTSGTIEAFEAWRWGRVEGTRCRGRCASCWPGGLCKPWSWGNGGRSHGASGCRSGAGPPRTSGYWAPPGSGLFLPWPESPDWPGLKKQVKSFRLTCAEFTPTYSRTCTSLGDNIDT